jgi:hypothetical protein
VSGLDLPLGPAVWGDSWLDLASESPGRRYRDLFSGQVLEVEDQGSAAGLKLAKLFKHFSLAMLERLDD